MIDTEYVIALRKPSARDLLFFRKKLTVTGTNGKTQGVSTASKPAARQIRKTELNDFEDSSFVVDAAFSVSVLFDGLREKLSWPLGKEESFLASQEKLPLI